MSEEIPTEFWQGVEQFNQQEFYPCHDTLEALWMEASEPQKRFYQGVLQIAVACYHLGNLNWRGAAILLGEGIGRIKAYEPRYSGIDVSQLIDQSAELLTALQEAGAENIAEFVEQMQHQGDIVQLPKIQRVDAQETSAS
ncbi:DUF309 domain-containing protein [Funiculus sociatus GB2-A5]|jgi:hypothetical protein|uniref:DUF309 domain-containing protein n=1 Tax=Funiculus sociatus GB2-A5 TaxID=2933946 RepID=A0ABV0JQ80_9CYAN|nr:MULTISPECIES: DUF309 domain-containing protein [unclassified Trichocoleus]MBD1908787.1 DUF309 domain-containing protein [Trichocoleus sp. FACHB-832]MBD2006747.1 DUF309 domain-containing protein [Trichocoleus sp. FACHB-40]MBD2065101.1 DUF309 domain-containing protein [Trichocoleus sp. FACHB-6]